MGRIFDALNHLSAPLPATEKPVGFDEPPSARDESAEIPFIEVGGPEEASSRVRAPSIPACIPGTETKMPAANGVRFQSAPRSITVETAADSPLSIWTRDDDPKANQYRAVRDAIRGQLGKDRPHAFLLLPVEAKSGCESALHLALAFAEDPGATLLIDATSPHSRLLAPLGAAQAPGWSELLAGTAVPLVVQDPSWPDLHVIAHGNRLVDSHAARSGERARSLLLQLKSRYDVILLKAPAWSESPAGLTLAHAADAACLLSHQPTPEHACLATLRREGVRVLGSVLLT